MRYKAPLKINPAPKRQCQNNSAKCKAQSEEAHGTRHLTLFLGAGLILFSILQGQWFEGNLYLPDSFSGTCGTNYIIWNAFNDRIYLGGSNETFVTIDCETDEKIAPLRINAWVGSRPQYFQWNRANNSLYIWCAPARGNYDSLHVVDCQTQQTIAYLPFFRRNYGGGGPAILCVNPTNNKVYLARGGDSLIFVIDGNTNQIIKSIRFTADYPIEDQYQVMKWNPVNNRLYLIGSISHNDTLGLAVIDCVHDSIIAFNYLNPHESGNVKYWFQIDSIRNRIYFSFAPDPEQEWKIYEVDGNTNQITNIFPTNFSSRNSNLSFCLNSQDRKIYYYYYYQNSGFIRILDIPSGTEDSIFVGVGVSFENYAHLLFWPRNNELYLFRCFTNPLVVIDLTTSSVQYYELPDQGDVYIAPFLHPIRGKLYISKEYGEAIVVFDCESKTAKVIFNGTADPNDILLNPIENKLYVTNTNRPYIFVFDSEHLRALRQVKVAPTGYGLACLGFAWRRNKAYISYPRAIAVLDCHTDSVIKTISGLASYYEFEYNPILDKIYTYDVSFFGNRLTYVIDCTTDSVIKVLQTTGSQWRYYGDIRFDSLTNKMYLTGGNSFVIIDCIKDSVIKRVSSINGGSIFFRTHGDRRVYVRDAMFDRFTDSLLGYLSFPIPGTSCPYAYNAINDQLYICKNTAPGGWLDRTIIYVVDCNTQTIIDSILVNFPGIISQQGMMWNPLNNKLYFTAYSDSLCSTPLMVADCRTNQVIATFFEVNPCRYLRAIHCLDPSINRLYVNVDGGSRYGMIRDNIIGIEEIANQELENRLALKIFPTLTKNLFRIEYSIAKNGTVKLDILDTLGRVKKTIKKEQVKLGSFQLNLNVSDLPAGVYFVRLKQDGEQIIERLVIVK